MCWCPMRAGRWGDCVIAILLNVFLLNQLCSSAFTAGAFTCVCAFSSSVKMYCRQHLCPWQGRNCFPLVIPNDLLSSVHMWIKLFSLNMFDLQPAPVCCADVCVSVCAPVICVSFSCICVYVCVCLCELWYIYIIERREEEKNNQSGSSLGPVTKVIQRFYQWAKVPVAMETLMNEKGPSNRGDGVNEELPHRLDTVFWRRMLF